MSNCQQCQTHPAAFISGVGYCVAHLALAAPAPRPMHSTAKATTSLRRLRVSNGNRRVA